MLMSQKTKVHIILVKLEMLHFFIGLLLIFQIKSTFMLVTVARENAPVVRRVYSEKQI